MLTRRTITWNLVMSIGPLLIQPRCECLLRPPIFCEYLGRRTPNFPADARSDITRMRLDSPLQVDKRYGNSGVRTVPPTRSLDCFRSVIDTVRQAILNRFQLPASRISNIHFANEQSSSATLICARAGGVIDFFEQSDTANLRATSRFRAIEHPDPVQPIVTAWNEPRGELWVTGGSSHISLWSGEQQRRTRRISLDGRHHVTCLTTEGTRGNLALCGFSYGDVALLDNRGPGDASCVKRWTSNSTKIVGVAMISASSSNELLSLRCV